MKLPLVPKHEKDYEVKEYPSNAEVLNLIRVQLRNEAIPEETKERLQERYQLGDATVSDELGPFEADLEAAEIVFEDFDTQDAGKMEISASAVEEATSVFMQAGGKQRNGQRDSLNALLSALTVQQET